MKPLIVANWKYNPTTLKEAKVLFGKVKRGIRNLQRVEVVICPPFVYLTNLQLTTYNLQLGAQDCFWEEKGAFTGEISPAMLKDVGAEYVIIGHSERRRYFGETDEMINKKLKSAILAKLKPILCIGETEEQRKDRKTEKILKNQLSTAFKNMSSVISYQSSVIIAYEPVWAIGTGNPCQPEEAKKVLLFLRTSHQRKLSGGPILYGGSVDSENAASYIKAAGFDGLLVGGASLNAKEFIKIIKKCEVL